MACHHNHVHTLNCLTDRRTLLKQTVSCTAHMALVASAMPLASRAAWAAESAGEVVAKEDFASLVKIADGVYAVISTPLTGSRATVSNGGLIVGKTGVLAIEGFQTPEGAAWLAGKAREGTGKWPTHVVLTHYHSDHANGVAGYLGGADHPSVRATQRTCDLVVERDQTPPDPNRVAAVKGAVILSPTAPTTLDLGGRSVKMIPRGGHTESDVTLELDDPSIVFCGDLVWNAMFPNFVDTTPPTMIASIKALTRTKQTLYVPGHGVLAHAPDITRYLAMHEEVEKAARKAHMAGTSAEDAAKTFALPASVGDWALFNPTSKIFYQRAFEAWYKSIKA